LDKLESATRYIPIEDMVAEGVDVKGRAGKPVKNNPRGGKNTEESKTGEMDEKKLKELNDPNRKLETWTKEGGLTYCWRCGDHGHTTGHESCVAKRAVKCANPECGRTGHTYSACFKVRGIPRGYKKKGQGATTDKQ
jgi:hypothetical protein